jgi:hypothetical protein
MNRSPVALGVLAPYLEINAYGIGNAGPVAEAMNRPDEAQARMRHQPSDLVAVPSAAVAVRVIAVDPE